MQFSWWIIMVCRVFYILEIILYFYFFYMLRIYHNPRCRKSREGLNFLREKFQDIEVVDYLKQGITVDEIREILLKLNLSPRNLVRENEELYKRELKHLKLNDREWIQVIADNPVLLRRPVILAKHKGVIGDPVENILKLLS